MSQEHDEITFGDFPLAPSILNALKKVGYEKPTPIQQRVIPLLLEGKDVVGQAHTGTGKTIAFGLPALHYVKTNPKAQVLILSPVRELAHQIHEEIFRFAGEGGVQMTLIHGGKSFSRQIESVRNGSQIVVATPGRLLDLLESNKIPTFHPAMVIIDEADEMLDKGFLDEIKAILSFFGSQRQTLLFSATMPEPIKQLAKTFLNQPTFIQIVNKEKTNQNIEQLYTLVEPFEREDALVRFLDTEEMGKTIVFCNTKKEVDHLSDILNQRGHRAIALHGDMEQAQRQKVMASFRKHDGAILIATEVAARGLNVEDVTHVFNYELPYGAESYVHRIGRTGRAGKLGKAISFVTPREFFAFERICKTLNASATYFPVPHALKAKERKRTKLISELKGLEVDTHAEYMLDLLKQEFGVDEAAKRLIKLVFKEDEISGPDVIGVDLKNFRKRSGGSDRGSERGSNRGSERGSGRGSERSSGRRDRFQRFDRDRPKQKTGSRSERRKGR
jgi:ATP-dependent RNA helicase DeaD